MGKGSAALGQAGPCAQARRGWGSAAGIFQPSDGAGNLARSFYVHVEQDLRKYLVWVQAPRVLPCWRSRNGCSLPTSVCLSVPGSCVWRSGPCLPLAVHPQWEGRAASASWHRADVEPCCRAMLGARHIPSTVTGQGNPWSCSWLPWRGEGWGSSMGWGGCLPVPGWVPLLCGDEVTSAPAGTRRGTGRECGQLGGTPGGCLPCPLAHPQAKGWKCLSFTVRRGLPNGP